MKPIWSAEAVRDLADLRTFIAEDNPGAAQRVALRIIQIVEELLPGNPEMGRPGRVSGTRELIIPRTPFVVPYRVKDGALQILRVLHAARRWPDHL